MKTIMTMILQVNMNKFAPSIRVLLLMTAIMCLVSVLQISAQVEMNKEQTIAYLNRLGSLGESGTAGLITMKFDADKITTTFSEYSGVTTCLYSDIERVTEEKFLNGKPYIEIHCSTERNFNSISPDSFPDGDIKKFANAIRNMVNPPAAWNQVATPSPTTTASPTPAPEVTVNSSAVSGNGMSITVTDDEYRKNLAIEAEKLRLAKEKADRAEAAAKAKANQAKAKAVPRRKTVRKGKVTVQ